MSSQVNNMIQNV